MTEARKQLEKIKADYSIYKDWMTKEDFKMTPLYSKMINCVDDLEHTMERKKQLDERDPLYADYEQRAQVLVAQWLGYKDALLFFTGREYGYFSSKSMYGIFDKTEEEWLWCVERKEGEA